MDKMDVSTKELIEAMQAILAEHENPEGDPGLTTNEWGKVWGISYRAARSRLRKLFEGGLLVSGRSFREAMDGRIAPSPVYRVKE